MTTTSQVDRALRLAALGMHVFPCHHPGSGGKPKSPMVPGGFNSATTDPAQIRAWWTTWPDAWVGVATGKSGLVVIDLDVKPPYVCGTDELDRRELDYESPVSYSTPSGGLHAHFRDGGEGLGPKVAFNGMPGVDIRAGGSYVVFYGEPPQALDDLPTVPTWLTTGARPRVSSGGVRAPGSSRSVAEIAAALESAEASTAYGAAALEAELENLASAREGTRNATLYEVGIKVGSLIVAGHLDGRCTVERVANAAVESGLPMEEVTSTLLRPGGALDIGMSSPRGPLELQGAVLEEAHLPDSPVVPSKLANFIDWGELFTSGPVEEDWLVPGFICSARGHSLYSDAGVGKSLLMRDIAACLAAGKEALGLPARPPLKVLYLDYENNAHTDIKSSLIDMGFDAAELSMLHLASFPEFGALDTAPGATKFLSVVDEINPELIVIDTLSRVIEGDENSNDTWNNFYKFTGSEIKKRNIAYVRLDHEGKNATNGARGGSAKRGDVDLVWRYFKRNGEFHLANEKSRGPLASELLVIERRLAPLKHVLTTVGSSGWNWPALYAIAERHEALKSMLTEYHVVHGAWPSQAVAWDTYRDRVGTLKGTRNDLVQALKDLQNPNLFAVE